VHTDKYTFVSLRLFILREKEGSGTLSVCAANRGMLCRFSVATGWTVRGSNPGKDEIVRISPDRSWGPTSLLYNGYRVFLEVRKRSGRDADPSPPSNTEV
jgi:hypothetical protein